MHPNTNIIQFNDSQCTMCSVTFLRHSHSNHNYGTLIAMLALQIKCLCRLYCSLADCLQSQVVGKCYRQASQMSGNYISRKRGLHKIYLGRRGQRLWLTMETDKLWHQSCKNIDCVPFIFNFNITDSNLSPRGWFLNQRFDLLQLQMGPF